MQMHANAKLGLAGSRALALAVREDRSVRAAARRFAVSPATAKKWCEPWEQASEAWWARRLRRRCSPAPALRRTITSWVLWFVRPLAKV